MLKQAYHLIAYFKILYKYYISINDIANFIEYTFNKKNATLKKPFKNLHRLSTITSWVYKPTGIHDGQDTADSHHLVQKGKLLPLAHLGHFHGYRPA